MQSGQRSHGERALPRRLSLHFVPPKPLLVSSRSLLSLSFFHPPAQLFWGEGSEGGEASVGMKPSLWGARQGGGAGLCPHQGASAAVASVYPLVATALGVL